MFFTVLETESLRSGFQQGQVLVKALFWVADGHLLAVCSHGAKSRRTLWHLFYKDTNATHEGSTILAQLPAKGNLLTLS